MPHKNKDEAKKYQQAYCLKHKDDLREYHRKYYRQNSVELRAKRLVRHNQNKNVENEYNKNYQRSLAPQKKIEYSKKYYRLNKEVALGRYRINRIKREGYIHNTPFDKIVTVEQWGKVLGSWGGLCAYCENGRGDTMDHVVPLSKGGSHSVDNVVPACRRCNSSKNGRTTEEWLGVTPIFISRGGIKMVSSFEVLP